MTSAFTQAILVQGDRDPQSHILRIVYRRLQPVVVGRTRAVVRPWAYDSRGYEDETHHGSRRRIVEIVLPTITAWRREYERGVTRISTVGYATSNPVYA